jgi:hypothetical protein
MTCSPCLCAMVQFLCCEGQRERGSRVPEPRDIPMRRLAGDAEQYACDGSRYPSALTAPQEPASQHQQLVQHATI